MNIQTILIPPKLEDKRHNGFERIDHITFIDGLDIKERLEEISKLKDGWFNGEGKALKRDGILWFTNVFENNFKTSLALPCLYPTIEGGLQAEWGSYKSEITMKINLEDKTANIHILGLEDDNEIEVYYDITLKESWGGINKLIEENL